MNEVGVFTAFIAGILSFISPCILPLVPAYLSYIGGSIALQEVDKKRLLLNIVAFILGFTIIFALLGVFSNLIGSIAGVFKEWIARIGGVLLIIMGLHMIGLYTIPFLNYEVRNVKVPKEGKLVEAFIFGITFAGGWVPCIGPILTAIISMATQTSSIFKAVLLFLSYSLGLAIPFLLAGLFTSFLVDAIRKYKKALKIVEIISGVFLVLLGIVLISGSILNIVSWLLYMFPWLQKFLQ